MASGSQGCLSRSTGVLLVGLHVPPAAPGLRVEPVCMQKVAAELRDPLDLTHSYSNRWEMETSVVLTSFKLSNGGLQS
jgi:hypothetical protein